MEQTETTADKLKTTQLAYEMAVAMSNFKGSFLARTAHELRSPLSSLISLHNLILGELCDNPEEEREFILQASQSALQLLDLLDKVVAISKLESCSNQLKLTSLALSEILEEVFSLTYLQATNYNLRLDFTFPEPEIYVHADFSWLRQVLVMIIEAGISSIETGIIKVHCQHEDADFVKINVEIPCEVKIENNPDNLVSLASNPKIQSRGLLSLDTSILLSQRVLELMGGSVSIASLGTAIQLQCLIPSAKL